MVKNLHFIVDNLSKLGLQTGAKDVRLYRSDLEKSIEKYIQVLLSEHFYGVDQIVMKFTQQKEEAEDGASSMEDSQDEIGHIQTDQLHLLQGKQLESVAQDFSYTYKQKAEQIAKELRDSISYQELLQKIGQKLMRLLSLRYATFVEIVKQWQQLAAKNPDDFGGNPPKLQLPTTNAVLLDLNNTQLN